MLAFPLIRIPVLFPPRIDEPFALRSGALMLVVPEAPPKPPMFKMGAIIVVPLITTVPSE